MPGRPNRYKPNPRECALLLLRMIEERDGRRKKKPMTRVRVSELSLKRRWNRRRLTQDLLSQVGEWMLTGGWALFDAGMTYAAVKVDAAENWPSVSSKRTDKELESVTTGDFKFEKLEHLISEDGGGERTTADEESSDNGDRDEDDR
jgi:hypothetical protein